MTRHWYPRHLYPRRGETDRESIPEKLTHANTHTRHTYTHTHTKKRERRREREREGERAREEERKATITGIILAVLASVCVGNDTYRSASY